MEEAQTVHWYGGIWTFGQPSGQDQRCKSLAEMLMSSLTHSENFYSQVKHAFFLKDNYNPVTARSHTLKDLEVPNNANNFLKSMEHIYLHPQSAFCFTL